MTAPLSPDMFSPECPSRAMPTRMGDKWMPLVLRCLEDGPRRFSELRVPLHRVTPKVLTETLRAMERDGLVTRTAYDESPPRVEYALTALGRSLLVPLDAVAAWCAEHAGEVHAARTAYGHAVV
jgi:DNA-binding HxlR family transcriptional regulator